MTDPRDQPAAPEPDTERSKSTSHSTDPSKDNNIAEHNHQVESDESLPDGFSASGTLLFHQGPYPPPEVLAQYEKIVPGSAKTIIDMTWENNSHQNRMDRDALSADRWTTHVGQLAAIVVTSGGLAVAAYALGLGHAAAATTIVTVVVGGLATAFIKARQYQAAADKDREPSEKEE